jgi:uncharacterized membrane protein
MPYVLWPVGSIFVLASRKKDDPYLHYHAVQGGLFGAAMLAVLFFSFLGLGITFRLLPGSSTFLPGMLGMATIAAGGLISMAVFFAAIFLGWRATEGEMIRLPFAGDFAEGKMLDHTGMTRREFLEMLEKSFIEPNQELAPIPFPEAPEATVLKGKAAELMATRAAQDATPATQKAAELLAQHQAKQAAAQQSKAAQAAALAASQQAAALAAQQAAALQAAQRPPAQPGSGVVSRPPAADARPAAAPARPQASEVKSYPLIGAGGQSGQRPPAAPGQPPRPVGAGGQPGQRPPAAPGQPPRPVGAGGQSGQRPPAAPGQAPRPAVSGGAPPAPSIKEVDLIRHYKERRSAAQQTEALKNWLSTVDEGPAS